MSAGMVAMLGVAEVISGFIIAIVLILSVFTTLLWIIINPFRYSLRIIGGRKLDRKGLKSEARKLDVLTILYINSQYQGRDFDWMRNAFVKLKIGRISILDRLAKAVDNIRGPLNQYKLAKLLDIDQGVMSDLLKDMEAEGLIVRKEASELGIDASRRKNIPILTDKGFEAVTKYSA